MDPHPWLAQARAADSAFFTSSFSHHHSLAADALATLLRTQARRHHGRLGPSLSAPKGGIPAPAWDLDGLLPRHGTFMVGTTTLLLFTDQTVLAAQGTGSAMRLVPWIWRVSHGRPPGCGLHAPTTTVVSTMGTRSSKSRRAAPMLCLASGPSWDRMDHGWIHNLSPQSRPFHRSFPGEETSGVYGYDGYYAALDAAVERLGATLDHAPSIARRPPPHNSGAWLAPFQEMGEDTTPDTLANHKPLFSDISLLLRVLGGAYVDLHSFFVHADGRLTSAETRVYDTDNTANAEISQRFTQLLPALFQRHGLSPHLLVGQHQSAGQRGLHSSLLARFQAGTASAHTRMSMQAWIASLDSTSPHACASTAPPSSLS